MALDVESGQEGPRAEQREEIMNTIAKVGNPE